MLTYVQLFATSLFTALALTPFVRALAERLGAVDRPDGARRVHERPVPRLGGVAVFAAVCVAFAVGGIGNRDVAQTILQTEPRLVALAAGATLMVLLGVLDDFRPLSPLAKLAGQGVAGLVVAAGGFQIQSLLGVPLGIADVPLTLLWIIAVTNAFNLIDGLDGLASGVGVIVSVTFAVLSIYSRDYLAALVLCALAGGLLGFLRYNFHPASIFLGDCGSLFVGFTLAVVSLGASNRPTALVAIVVPMLALGLPLADGAIAVVRRALRSVHVARHDEERERYELRFTERIALFRPDREHIHHRLLTLGLDHRNAVLVLYGVSLLFGAGALALVLFRQPNQGLLLATFSVAAFIGLRRLNYGEMQVLRNGVLLPFFDTPMVSRRIFHVLVDVVFILVSYLAALMIAHDGSYDVAIRQEFLTGVPLLALVQLASFWANGLYVRAYRYTGMADLVAVLRALAFAIVAGAVALSVSFRHPPMISVWALDGYILATFAIGTRVSFRFFEHFFAAERRSGRRAIIYGAGKAGLLAFRELVQNPSLGMIPVGFLDDAPAKRHVLIHGLRAHGRDELQRLIRARFFDELIVATSKVPEDRLREVAEACEGAGIPVRRLSVGWDPLPLASNREVGSS